jgi:hypothetical protein
VHILHLHINLHILLIISHILLIHLQILHIISCIVLSIRAAQASLWHTMDVSFSPQAKVFHQSMRSWQAHSSFCSSLSWLLLASQSTDKLYKMHNRSSMWNMQDIVEALFSSSFWLPARPSLNHEYPHANQAFTMPKTYPEPSSTLLSSLPSLQSHSSAYTSSTWNPPSCSLPSTPQTQTSLYPPTWAPKWPIQVLPSWASASQASLAPLAATT